MNIRLKSDQPQPYKPKGFGNVKPVLKDYVVAKCTQSPKGNTTHVHGLLVVDETPTFQVLKLDGDKCIVYLKDEDSFTRFLGLGYRPVTDEYARILFIDAFLCIRYTRESYTLPDGTELPNLPQTLVYVESVEHCFHICLSLERGMRAALAE